MPASLAHHTTFYPTPRHAMAAPAESLAYVGLVRHVGRGGDAIGVIDVAPGSPDYGTLVGRVDMPAAGDGLARFGWDACSSQLAPWARAVVPERRHLLVPAARSARIHVLDTHPDPRQPRLVRTVGPSSLARDGGARVPHSVHGGPDGIYVATHAGGHGEAGGVVVLDRETFAVRSEWRGGDDESRYAISDFAWLLGHDVLVTAEWGGPETTAAGLDVGLLRAGRYGHRLDVWDRRTCARVQSIELGPTDQGIGALRAAHDPRRAYGFASTMLSARDLSASVWVWYLERARAGGGTWKARRIVSIPAERHDERRLVPGLRGFGVVPPLVTDLALSLDDRFLLVACWGTGELRRYEVSDPFAPRLVDQVQLGGIGVRVPHPATPRIPRAGGPARVELSRDGRRAYVTSSFARGWDAQFHPGARPGWMAKVDVPSGGPMRIDPRFLVETAPEVQPRHVRLEGGDASSDFYCYSA